MEIAYNFTGKNTFDDEMNVDKLTNLITASRYFYREYTAYNLIFTIISLYFLVVHGLISISYILWLKLFGYAFLAFLYQVGRKNYFYFFHNLGINKTTLYISAILTDLITSILIFLIFYQLVN